MLREQWRLAAKEKKEGRMTCGGIEAVLLVLVVATALLVVAGGCGGRQCYSFSFFSLLRFFFLFFALFFLSFFWFLPFFLPLFCSLSFFFSLLFFSTLSSPVFIGKKKGEGLGWCSVLPPLQHVESVYGQVGLVGIFLRGS